MKRTADIFFSVVGLILASPVIAGVAFVVLAVHGRPVLFRQPRPGLGGKVFDILKFRTMVEPDGERVTDGQRLTRLGRFLRASSLDELPSLWNVMCGDMSFVGPRPLIVEYLDLYTLEQARRHEVRPGITGLAQVKGRNDLEWADRFRIDVEYVDGRCPRLDFSILLQTVHTVVGRRGISKHGHDTMPVFTGWENSSDVDQ
ncbi:MULTISPECIES: sugar transferase [unclassified Brevibacterium]|uniref:sugar transferase n=1 Tax=unclassified Brevibacterium TaxID=2614124 RepID=UPI00254D0991|nr:MULTISPECIES: sugar transferase [unclassified Brevibacterium]MDK8434101.1 sugar transferase [Brevibacterium sp. H-BE7]